MTDQSSHYFARGNTARGAHFLYQSAFDGLNKIFVLSGPQGTGKSTILRKISDHLLDIGKHVQCFHSPLRPNELDGIIATELKVGLIDGRVCEGIPDCEIVKIDLGRAVDSKLLLSEQLSTIENLQGELAAAYDKAYETFLTALKIHDEWESYYIESMDFEKADVVAQGLIKELYDGQEKTIPVIGRHLFFGAATPKGAFDFIQRLTMPLERRIYIKGRPGSGKSTLLKKLAAAAETNGIEVQIFHCGFDPNSLDMLIFPELSTAIFDSTAPHEYFPERNGDEILDMYTLTMSPGTDEAYAVEIAEIKERYSAKMKEATSFLASAEAIDAQIKAFYVKITDYTVVEALGEEILSEIDEQINQPT
ncbi:hypothetical protein P5G65_25460 [Paenibacillus chondroitinus]|uniref:NACHT domain-containing protein n=1 Tax=Paenibacillus chondroitinus TaxID=59842 RepID=A0ABU6DK70_9BACL|nr:MULTISPECIES: hypothetical protein [Paenibacillus]MCY9662729.1 hypothetical protein [Paenibacillus anseongense]MEB4797256.1 hypothetical protein [Paenibacillus chondroitinus]